MKTVGERLRRMIGEHRATPAEVADAAGMSRQQLHRILSGVVENPGILTVERVVGAIGGTMAEYHASDDRPGSD